MIKIEPPQSDDNEELNLEAKNGNQSASSKADLVSYADNITASNKDNEEQTEEEFTSL